MNIFMPEISIHKSVEALDDKRLIKQILECYQIIKINDRVLAGEENVGYRNHPVVKFYRYKRAFVILYGLIACKEYIRRFNKVHTYNLYFTQLSWDIPSSKKNETYNILYCEKRKTGLYENSVEYIPDESAYNDVHELFREKLINKWKTDKRPPKWTNGEHPGWYKDGTCKI